MRNRRGNAQRLRRAVEALPAHTKRGMLEGIRANRVIVGAYTDKRGGVCPMLAAHRNGGRTDFGTFAKAWDAYTGAKKPRRASAREVRTLRGYLEVALIREGFAPPEHGGDVPLGRRGPSPTRSATSRRPAAPRRGRGRRADEITIEELLQRRAANEQSRLTCRPPMSPARRRGPPRSRTRSTRRRSELPFVSVVVPVRNGAGMIGDCIASLLACDYPPDRHEILVVDNGSTDATAEVIRRHPVAYLTSRGAASPTPATAASPRAGERSSPSSTATASPTPPGSPSWPRPFADPEVGCVAGELRHAPGDHARRAPGHPHARRVAALRRQLQPALRDHRQRRLPPRGLRVHRPLRHPHAPRPGRRARPPLQRAQPPAPRLRPSTPSPATATAPPSAASSASSSAGPTAPAWSPPSTTRSTAARARRPACATSAPRSAGSAITLRLPGPRRGRREWVEDAWFGLMRQIAWYVGARAGMRRGARIFRGEAQARSAAGGPAYPEPPRG